jgi:hypothetical protein
MSQKDTRKGPYQDRQMAMAVPCRRNMITGSCLVSDEGKQRDDPGPLNSRSQSPLMLRAGTGHPAGHYLSPIGDKPAQHIRVFVVYFQLLGTEFTDLLLKKNLSFTAAAAAVLTVPAVYLAFYSPFLPGVFVFCIFFIRHICSLPQNNYSAG